MAEQEKAQAPEQGSEVDEYKREPALGIVGSEPPGGSNTD
jgi:hypothetical protein